MLLNVRPLRENRDFRLLFIGQLVSFLGSMVSYVAVPYQVYGLTKDNAIVGALGLAQLLPVLIFGILGGTYADRLNRRRMLLVCEGLMSLIVVALAVNAFRETPSVPAIFALVAVLQGLNGFHRPAMDALTQKLVAAKDYTAVSALSSFRSAVGHILGPALGGLIIALWGVKAAYLFDVVTFSVAFIALYLMSRIPDPERSTQSPWADARAGLRYALSKPELVGTYVIDIVAMVFAFPVALFPAMSDAWGGATAAGMLLSSMAVGSLILTLFSGWTGSVKHHGRAVVLAAAFWAVFIIGVGLTDQFWIAVTFLALAGAADMISGMFRGIIWNETVPNTMRGRLSGIEMISYMSGPLLGNARAGWMAAKYNVAISVSGGGIICVLAVVGTAFCLPAFWRYRSTKS